jgi:AcrR family transcriptional regulator
MSSGKYGKAISERRAQTRERLLNAAAKAIAEKGLHATTLDEIAARAGLTKGAIYDNFESKDELFLALVARQPVGPEWPSERHGAVKQRLRHLAKLVIEENDATRNFAPIRAEFLLYALTHADTVGPISSMFEDQLNRTEARIRVLFDESELILAPREFAILLENFIPSLAYTRSWSPHLISEADITSIFESFARSATKRS